jgi:hypothetical protein
MKANPLLKLREFGQSIWLDDISRGMIRSGELLRMVEEDGLCGVTSNPSIFEKAIAETHDYDDAIRDLAAEGRSVEEILQTITVDDVRAAATRSRATSSTRSSSSRTSLGERRSGASRRSPERITSASTARAIRIASGQKRSRCSPR